MFDTALIPIGAPGTGKRSWNLPGSFQVAGLTIDNPSGSWLYIPADNTYIPPYTLGFAHSFAPTLSSIDILFANGPAGQVSTQLGDPPMAYIYDTPVAESAGQVSSAGASFVQGFTPIQTATLLQVVSVSGGAIEVNFVLGVANRRHRLLTFAANLIGMSAGYDQVTSLEPAPAFFFVKTSPGSTKFSGLLTPIAPNFSQIFPNGLDCEIGARIAIVMSVYYATVQIDSNITFQTI